MTQATRRRGWLLIPFALAVAALGVGTVVPHPQPSSQCRPGDPDCRHIVIDVDWWLPGQGRAEGLSDVDPKTAGAKNFHLVVPGQITLDHSDPRSGSPIESGLQSMYHSALWVRAGTSVVLTITPYVGAYIPNQRGVYAHCVVRGNEGVENEDEWAPNLNRGPEDRADCSVRIS